MEIPSKGLFGRLFHNRNAQAAKSAPQPSGEPPSQALPADKTGSETEKTDDSLQTATPETIVQLPLFSEAGHIWDDFLDPLYTRPSEERMIQQCRVFVRVLERQLAQEAAKKTFSQKTGMPEADAEEHEEQPPVDASFQLLVSSDHMAVWVYAISPSEGGKGLSLSMLQSVLKENNVKYGLIQENIQNMLEHEPYGRPILIARGQPAKNGVNGSITEHYKREIICEFVEDSKGNIDFKQLNNIQQIKTGDVICDIIKPIPGIPGFTVTGTPIPPQILGKDAKVPQGTGTCLSEDHTQLVARTDGHVIFKNSVFQIEPVLKINGDVDGSTGNLDFNGDISITGDVRNGFSVNATGSILVLGSVEGAVLTAGGDIRISNGVTGNGRAVLTAGGGIQCKFLEHCTATAMDNIQTESLVLCKIQTSHNVLVTTGIGAIIGGQVVASSIEAKSIGSKARHTTSLVIGTPYAAVAERRQVEQELTQANRTLEELNKNINYLELQRNPAKQHLLTKLKEARKSITLRKKDLDFQMEHINEQTYDFKDCRITCSRLYPITNLQIGQATLRVNDEYSNCNIYYNDEKQISIGFL